MNSNIEHLLPKDRVKQSLEKLDIPQWYKEKSERVENTMNNNRVPVWRKGSFSSINISSTTPPETVSPWSTDITDLQYSNKNPLFSSTPSHSEHQPADSDLEQEPYLGWRAAKQPPTFLTY